MTVAAVLLSVSAIADTDTTVIVTTETSAVSSSNEVSRDRAEKATIVATENAIAAILADTKLDLDIRLIGPTAVKIAGDR